jgi:1,4-dihydroxy-2-naphthoate octaprenyltransferase
MKLRVLIKSTRLPFLILTPAYVFLGASSAVANQVSVDLSLLVLALLGAVLAHISVNAFNEYFDFKSGLDFTTVKTHFTGGSGALPGNPEMANAIFTVGAVSLGATILIGFFFAWKCGLGIIPTGVLGLMLIVTYTGRINKHPFLCLVAPGIGFGFLMVTGTQFVLAGKYSTLSWLVAAVPFFLVNNLLLLNQYPDVKADAGVGRNHFPIAYGFKASNMVYAFFVMATIAVIIGCILAGYFPTLSLIALLPMPLAFFSLKGAIKYGSTIGEYPRYLGANVAVAIMTPLILGVSLITG